MTTTASIEVSPDYDLPALVRAAKGDPLAARYEDGCLYVPGVTQAKLNAALAAYDPATATQPPVVVPATISDRQFAHGLWKQSVITFEEARDFLKVGQMPAALAALVGQMPAAQRQDAELMITGSTVFERAHPFTAAIAAAFGWTDEVTDEFWTYAASL